jgi:hypothetical protein
MQNLKLYRWTKKMPSSLAGSLVLCDRICNSVHTQECWQLRKGHTMIILFMKGKNVLCQSNGCKTFGRILTKNSTSYKNAVKQNILLETPVCPIKLLILKIRLTVIRSVCHYIQLTFCSLIFPLSGYNGLYTPRIKLGGTWRLTNLFH